MSCVANELRAAAACWPKDWPPQDRVLWEVPRAFLGFDEAFGDLGQDLPWFMLMAAESLHPTLPAADLRRVARYLLAENGDDSWLPWGDWQRLAALLDNLARTA